MTVAPETRPNPPAWPFWRLALAGLSAVALVLSSYLAWQHVTGGAIVGCGGGNSCDQVLSSRWSSIGGGWALPVSSLAAGAYLAILLATFFVGPSTPAADRRLAWGAMLILGGAIAASAIWFTILQKSVVGAFCPYCMATHAAGLLIAAIVLWRATRRDTWPSPEPAPVAPASNSPPAPIPSPATQRLFGPASAVGLPFAGLILATMMATLQVAFPPPAVFVAGESSTSFIKLDPRAVPLVGSPDAPSVVTLFFDFKCSHCQRVHNMLEETIHRFDGQLAFALCPAPLSSQCNPYVAGERAQFRDSCELARLGLAVWLADRKAFAQFDQWMFAAAPDEPWRPRPLEAALAKAAELVGPAKLAEARTDPRVDRLLETSIQLYGQTILSGNAVPKLVFGPRWAIPEPTNVDELVEVLQVSLKVPMPAPER